MTCPTIEDSDQPGYLPIWSESSQCAQWVAEDPMFLHADSENWSDWWMPRLIWVFAGSKGHFVGFVMRQLICIRWRLRSACASLLSNQSLLSAWRSYRSLIIHKALREDSDESVQMLVEAGLESSPITFCRFWWGLAQLLITINGCK